jgi:hypothetical protein
MNSATPIAPPYYKDPDATVRPGDIMRLAPFFQAIRAPLVHVSSNKSLKGGRELTDLVGGRGAVVPEKVLLGQKETEFVVPGRFDFALLLTRGCDIEETPHRQLAAIRPLAVVQGGAERKADVIEGKATSLHYLPPAKAAGVALFDDSFIDFRFIVTLSKDLFDGLHRPLALTRDGLLDVYFSWMRHAIGQKIPATTSCLGCGEPVPVFAAIEEVANPPADY